MEKYLFRCNDCGKEFSGSKFKYLCPSCESVNHKNLPPKGVLHTIYDYDSIKKGRSNVELHNHLVNTQFIDLLPVTNIKHFPKLRIGQTPVYNLTENVQLKSGELWVKDDSQNPTYSFKDRASALVSAYARENGIKTIVAASTGNAGSSIAGIGASQQQKIIVCVPAKAPLAKLTQIVMYGATLVPVDGTYDEAFDISIEISNHFGFLNRNTAYNPFTIEGKKTAAFEIFQQFYPKLPDKIIVPVGDGVILSGIYKGFEDLLKLQLIEKMPEIIGVQSTGSRNISANYKNINFICYPSSTVADSISVDIPRNYFMAAGFLKKYAGTMIEVSDDEIILASKKLSQHSGLFTEPASASAMAAFYKLLNIQSFNKNSRTLILLTGSGLKDVGSLQTHIKLPKKVAPDVNNIKKVLEL